jgi:hypothetical protein
MVIILIDYCQLYNKSLDADGIYEIPNKLIKVLLYEHYILIKIHDIIEILNLTIYSCGYFPY